MTFDEFGDIDPIDIVESLATAKQWDFDRPTDDQIAMAIEGQWRTYSITLAWSGCDETLRMICTFDMEPPENSRAKLFEMLNLVNDRCWAGAFTWWATQKLMVYRYGLVLSGEQVAAPGQVFCMIETAVFSMERYYPAFQLALWSDQSPEEALQVAIAEGFGRA
jgi:hypothetical protein